MDIRKSLIAAATAVAAVTPAPAVAAPTAQANGRALILVPLSLTKIDDLDFGTVITSNTPGTVRLNANTGVRSFTDGVTGVASSPGRRALFGGAGTGGQQVLVVVVPPVQLTNANGDTIDVDALTIDNNGNPFRTVDPVTRTFFVNVGGILSVGANQPDGLYTATFQVIANYQ